ncbi:adenylate cyclase [Rhizobiales bacterium GAS113]|nr:adenylate cyclase [Rhizobiales bacterium GAS113]
MANERVERRLAAILAADIAGYSRLMGADEEGTLAQLKACRRKLVDPKIAEHRGRIVKTTGDGMLVEFASVVDALRCAVEVQQTMAQCNAEIPPDNRIEFRVGINVGDIMIDGGDIFGDGVNVAARLEALCQPGGLCISRAARDQARDKLTFPFADLGEQNVKNIARPIRAFGLTAAVIAALPAENLPCSVISAETPPGEPKPLALPNKPSIAVLAFQNMSGDPEQEYFADGMAEDIITALSRVRSFFVVARNSSFTYKGRAVDIKQVGRDFGVRYVLEGSVRKASDHVRITAQLIDATTGNHIWSDRYDGGIEDIFELQDRITESVVGAIHPSIFLAEIERTKRKRPESLDAYDYVLRALPHIWALDPTANATALNHLNRAVEIEPDYPLALSLAAWCHAQKVTYSWTPAPDEAKAEALRLARLAGDMHNDDPLVLTMLCAAHSVVADLDMASALIEKAVTLDPNSAVAWNRSGWLNVYLMRPEVAIDHFQRAMRLSPFDPMNFNCFFGIGLAHFVAERYEEALPWYRKGMLERPDLVWPLRSVAVCLGLLGRISEAREAVRQLRQGYPDITISRITAGGPLRGDLLSRYAEGLRLAGLPE